MITLLLQLFWTFFLIGLFGFGGGYAMISMIQGEVVGHYHWMTMGQFTDIVAVSQSTPGPIGTTRAIHLHGEYLEALLPRLRWCFRASS